MNKLLLFLGLLFCTSLSAQDIEIRGVVKDFESGKPLEGVLVHVQNTNLSTITDHLGEFAFTNLDLENLVLEISSKGFKSTNLDVDAKGESFLTIKLIPAIEFEGGIEGDDIIPTITLTGTELNEEQSQDISGLLTASRDVFVNTAAFVFSFARFRIRGYDSQNTSVLLNNTPMNDLESGRVFWGSWGGLNDAMRNRENKVGLDATYFSFGGPGGASQIDSRASRQRKQIRVSYASANRSYRNRVMATVSTGMMKNGWAITVSGSKRWANEGYVPGSFYDAYAYFLSVDKKLGENHLLSLTTLGSPNRRGRNGAAVQEMYDLAGTNYYNPYWGYQNGEKRNSRVSNFHQPMGILNHEWKLGDDASLMTSVSYQFGRGGSTAFEWYKAANPAPDYYRNLPSFFDNEHGTYSEEVRDAVKQAFEEDENVRQIDWHGIYDINRDQDATTIKDVNGVADNDVSGKLSKYIIEDRRYDTKRFNFNTLYQNAISDNVSLNFGLHFQNQKTENFKVVDDLLGGDFYIDLDDFAESDFPGDVDIPQNDLNNPNRVLYEGDIFGYKYDANIQKYGTWLQGVFTTRKVDFHLGADISRTSMWRTGHFRNGRFPDNSFGDSEKQNFTNFGLKGGLTYKINGRNYIYANSMYMTRAPYFRSLYASPRTRDLVLDGQVNEKIFSSEAGYILKMPSVKARATVYYTTFKDQSFVRSFYIDGFDLGEESTTEIRDFGNFSMLGIDKEHLGAELALSVKVLPPLTINAVAALSQNIFDSRPNAFITLDSDPAVIEVESPIYIKNFYVSGMPQQAYTLGLAYQGKDFWSVYLNFNYYNDTYIDFSPIRRTEAAVQATDVDQSAQPDTELWEAIIHQEKVPGAFTIDLSAYKSFKFGDYYVNFNLGITNLLNKKNYITGGYEQLRFDFEDKDVNRFPSKYYYAYGLTYFASVTLRM